MKKISKIIKDIIIGGVLFIIPLIVVILIAEKAFSLAKLLVKPIVKILVAKEILGVAADIIMALGVILFIFFIAGIISRTPAARRSIAGLEDKLLSRIPLYTQLKYLSNNLLKFEQNKSLKTTLVDSDEGKRIAFRIKKINENSSLVYIPDAPNPWSGSLVLIENKKVKEIDLPVNIAVQIITSLGTESQENIEELVV